MMKYLYIDDEPASSTKNNVRKLNYMNLSVEPQQIKEWEEEVSDIIKAFNEDSYDGLLIDWQLKNFEYKKGSKANYDAESIAQHLRSLTTSKTLNKSFPIILCSAAKNLRTHLKKDSTAEDLFDLIVTKNQLVESGWETYAKMFYSLSKGYADINEKKSKTYDNLYSLLGLNAVEGEKQIDFRALEYLKIYYKEKSIHEFVRFFSDNVIKPDCFLIKETTVAARLGIDIKKSKDWSMLKSSVLDKLSYKGVFHEGWPQWWFSLIEDWWNSNISSSNTLRRTNAEEKISLLKEKTNFKNLNAISPSKYMQDTNFWTTCEMSKVSISDNEGIRVFDESSSNYPWIDKKLMSIEYALDKAKTSQIHPVDRWKVKALKKRYESNKQPRTRR